MDTYNSSIPIISMIPFVLMLGAIAVMPLSFNRFWEKNKNKFLISVILSVPVIIFLVYNNLTVHLVEILIFDYVPFIILLGALFTITGGIYLTGDIEARPTINTLFLGIGALLASIMGTTGAAMLLIRPVIQTNKHRKHKIHTILFFIGIVANCGGLLTPLGDPPLFMMYLRGAPFEWFFSLTLPWLTVNFLLLLIYFVTDTLMYKKEPEDLLRLDKKNIKPIKIEGKLNFVWLTGVVLSIAFINEQYMPFIELNHYFKFIREAVIVLLAYSSLKFTPHLLRVSNSFTWGPIEEVAYLFFGIFITMVPCLLYLQNNAQKLGVTSAQQFYYYTGLLSSFLDNTPTAVTFHSLAIGLKLHADSIPAGVPDIILRAICLGAVFFGSMTYIGNGPNFMVKAVAEENNIKMPDFFSYMLRFSLIVLLPVFVIAQLLFV